jgi:endoglucanase
VPVGIPPLLRDLLTAVGPSGQEGPAAAVWREAAAGFAEVSSDTLGTSFARVSAGEGRPTLALVGHIDEIGSRSRTSRGRPARFSVLGGFDPSRCPASAF